MHEQIAIHIPAHTVYKGRWGYHSCDYQTYAKIKKIHRHFEKAWKAWHDYQRWARKYPQNRVICKHVRNAKGQRCGSVVVGPRPMPQLNAVFFGYDFSTGYPYLTVDPCLLDQLYRLARKCYSHWNLPLDLNVIASADDWERIEKLAASIDNETFLANPICSEP